MIDMKTFRKLHQKRVQNTDASEAPASRQRWSSLHPDANGKTSEMPPDDEFIFMTQSTIFGFDLAEKKWGMFPY
jgi:hypothetical protein